MNVTAENSTYIPISMAKGPGNCAWVSLQLRDRNAPGYATDVRNGNAEDLPFGLKGDCNLPPTLVSDSGMGLKRAYSLTGGNDGALYFAAVDTVHTPPTIGKVTDVSGRVTFIPVSAYPDADIQVVAAGLGNTIWYTLTNGVVGTLVNGQQGPERKLSTGTGNMALGSDGNMWMAVGAQIVKIAPDLTTTSYQLPTVPGTSIQQYAIYITAAADGNIWYASDTSINNPTAAVVGKITPKGAISSWLVDGAIGAITDGPDGAVWAASVQVTSHADHDNLITVSTGYAQRIQYDGTVTENVLFTRTGDKANVMGTDTAMGIAPSADGKLYAAFKTTTAFPTGTLQDGWNYAITPDAPGTAADPTVTVLTSGTGTGAVKMKFSKSVTNGLPLVTLIAQPTGDSTFDGFSDQSCTTKQTSCQVVVQGNKTVTASFSVPVAAKAKAYQGAVFTGKLRRSYFRFYADKAGPVDITLLDPKSGDVVVQKRVDVGTNGMVQIGTDELGLTDDAQNNIYTVQMQAGPTFSGSYQHVLWDSSLGVISNLTSCGTPQSNSAALGFVNSSALSGGSYTSSIVITNTTSRDIASVTLDVKDKNGIQLGTYSSDTISANGSKVIVVSELEQRAGLRPNADQSQYLVRPQASFTGTLQHLVTNAQAGGVITDMTLACPLNGTN